MMYKLEKIKDGNQIVYRPFVESITTINVSLPNLKLCRPKPTIAIGSQILEVGDMELFAKALLMVCRDARCIEEVTKETHD